jgi:hypothetical protein
VTGTIKKNIKTTTIYIFCVVWVLTVPKYIYIRLNPATLVTSGNIAAKKTSIKRRGDCSRRSRRMSRQGLT